jgi:hypothetical protein
VVRPVDRPRARRGVVEGPERLPEHVLRPTRLGQCQAPAYTHGSAGRPSSTHAFRGGPGDPPRPPGPLGEVRGLQHPRGDSTPQRCELPLGTLKDHEASRRSPARNDGGFAHIGGSSGAITGGQLDGNRHSNVAIIYFYQPDGRFRCSATLVSPTVLITAGHCTDGVRGKVVASFESVAPAAPRAADDPGDSMSSTGFVSAPTGWLIATPRTHPLWEGELKLNDLHDVGVVMLDAPYAGATPAQLAPRKPRRC